MDFHGVSSQRPGITGGRSAVRGVDGHYEHPPIRIPQRIGADLARASVEEVECSENFAAFIEIPQVSCVRLTRAIDAG